MFALRKFSMMARALPIRSMAQRTLACPRFVQVANIQNARNYSGSGAHSISELEEELAALQISDDVNYNPIVVLNALKEKEEDEVVMCEVILAKELDNDQRKKLEDVLAKFLKPEEKLKMNMRIDPKIVGGMIVAIGDKYFDMSIATKVQKLGNQCEK